MKKRLQTSRAANWLIIATLFLTGCAPVTARWQEEVELSDGQKIVIDRQVLFEKQGGEWGRDSGWRASGERITFIHPVSGTEVTWSEPHRIASFLDIVDGRVWIVARQRICGSADRGQSFWQAFELRSNGWARVASDQAPAITTPNLALDSADYSQTSHWRFLSIALKHALDKVSQVDPRVRHIRWPSELDC